MEFTPLHNTLVNLGGFSLMLGSMFLVVVHISYRDHLVVDCVRSEFGLNTPIPSWFQRRVRDYNASFGSGNLSQSSMWIFFAPMAMGALMLLGGDFHSKICGFFGVFWGVFGLVLILGNEHRVYLEDKKGQERYELFEHVATQFRTGAKAYRHTSATATLGAGSTDTLLGQSQASPSGEGQEDERLAYLERMRKGLRNGD